MPIYDYVCSACGHRFEVLHGLNETGPHQCPVCEGPVARAFAPPTIVFKGSGWARVDRRSAASSPRRRSSGGSGSGGGSSDSASGDSASARGDPGPAPTTTSSGSDD
ncbi:MAG: FmdB family transcriptional regulator [Chloroflexi bacterium]|nr:FmdB family transcriptional regulator [Chloroflexota bacterium]